jgi:hypothetical protein
VAEPRRAQAFTREQAVGDQCAGQAVQALEKQACFFESALLLVTSTLTST